MSIFSKLLNAVGDVTGISSVGEAAKSILGIIKSNPELELKMKEYEHQALKMEMQENASVRELFQVEVKSEDKFVRRARPAMLWLVFSILSLNFGVIPVLNALTVAFGGEQIVIVYPNLPEEVYWLIGSIFGLYTGARSWDKRPSKEKK